MLFALPPDLYAVEEPNSEEFTYPDEDHSTHPLPAERRLLPAKPLDSVDPRYVYPVASVYRLTESWEYLANCFYECEYNRDDFERLKQTMYRIAKLPKLEPQLVDDMSVPGGQVFRLADEIEGQLIMKPGYSYVQRLQGKSRTHSHPPIAYNALSVLINPRRRLGISFYT
jgi:hypothetical protein